MASPSGGKKPWYQSTARLLATSDPYEIVRVTHVQEAYIDKSQLQAFGTGIFTGIFKTEEDVKWTVIILPEEIRKIAVHNDIMPFFTKVGMDVYFSLPAWGADVKRSYQLLNSLKEDGTARIDGPDGVLTTVTISEDLIRDALQVPQGHVSLLTRNTQTETRDTFLLLKGADYTYKDLVRLETETSLRIFMQHFQHGKAVRYTRPHRKLAAIFAKGVASRANLRVNFAEFIHTELHAFVKRLKKKKQTHLNCTLMLTRIAYYATGMIDELPPPQTTAHWVSLSSGPAPRTVRERTAAAPGTRTRSTERARDQAERTASSSSEDSESEDQESSEKTETDEEEQYKDLEEALKERPAISAQRARWERILEERRQRELRTKRSYERRQRVGKVKERRSKQTGQSSTQAQHQEQRQEQERQAEAARLREREQRLEDSRDRSALAERQRKILEKTLKRQREKQKELQENAQKRQKLMETPTPMDTEEDLPPSPAHLPTPPPSPVASSPIGVSLPQSTTAPVPTLIPMSRIFRTILVDSLDGGRAEIHIPETPSDRQNEANIPSVAPSTIHIPIPTTILPSMSSTIPSITTIPIPSITTVPIPDPIPISLPPTPSTTILPTTQFNVTPIVTHIPTPALQQTTQSPTTFVTPTTAQETIRTSLFPHIAQSTEPAHTSPGPLTLSTSPLTSIIAPLISTPSHTSLQTPFTTHVTTDAVLISSQVQKSEAQSSVAVASQQSQVMEPFEGGIVQAAQLIQRVAAHISTEAVKLQDENVNLQEEIGHLQLARTEMSKQLKADQMKISNFDESIKAAHAQTHIAMEELDKERGKVMALTSNIFEEQQKRTKIAKDYEEEIEKLKWSQEADLKVKEIQIETAHKATEAAQRATSLSQRRLKQAEAMLDEFLVNPLSDPTTDTGKDQIIRNLRTEVEDLTKMNKAMADGYNSQLHKKDEEMEALRKELVLTKEKLELSEKRRLSLPASSTHTPAPTLPTTTAAEQTGGPAHIDFPETSYDEPGPSQQTEEPFDVSSELPQRQRYPHLPEVEEELQQKIDMETNPLIRENMEWERRILHSGCLALLTPEDFKKPEFGPSLPYALLKLEVLQIKQRLQINVPTNELGGYAQIPVKDYEVAEIEANQPEWRKNWLQKDPMHKLYYITAPQEMRIDPTFCPIRRRRAWENFQSYTTDERRTWLNYPVLLPPQRRQRINEKYVVDTLNYFILKLKGIPDLSCVMLVKICKMLVTIITSFNNLARSGAHWTTYFEGPNGLAWDLSMAPSKDILYGLYARCIFLPAHYLVTFEEAFYTGFFEIETKIFSMINQEPKSRYVAFMRMEVERPLHDVYAEAEQQDRIQRMEAALRTT